MRPQRWVRTAALSVAALFLGACGSTLRVTSQATPGAALSAPQTWDWYPSASLGVHDSRVDTSAVSAVIRDAIAAALAAKGHRRDSTTPDFLVDYHGRLEQKRVELVVRPYCPGDPEPPLAHQEPYCREYEEGVLTIHVLDRRGERLVWSCEARDEVDFTVSVAQRRRRTEEARPPDARALPGLTRPRPSLSGRPSAR